LLNIVKTSFIRWIKCHRHLLWPGFFSSRRRSLCHQYIPQQSPRLPATVPATSCTITVSSCQQPSIFQWRSRL